ncbi:NACHT, LRR and PYD domains-containing protein 4-like [Hyperolius riggenbachi]|uniref:NACHT, LRR and PYD domains-containing protein 4-like n=1 Tax=Hyperolius riggenbachi TaxID=752182 RepID=UPI0035A3442B
MAQDVVMIEAETARVQCKSVKTLVLCALKELVDDEFKEFRNHLCEEALAKEFGASFRRSEVEKKDRIDIANLLISRYTTEEAPHVTYKVLEAIEMVDVARKFHDDLQKNGYPPIGLR